MMRSGLRTWLFAPGNKPAVMAKAAHSGADITILDLEDAVPEAEKDLARTEVAGFLASFDDRQGLAVRINALSTPYAYEDILAIARLAPFAIMLPKAETAEDIRTLDWLLSQVQRAADRPIAIIPLIETAAGLANVRTLAAASERIRCLAFGAGDYTLDLGLHWSPEETELLAARCEIAVASRIAAIGPPVDAVWVAIEDEDGMAASALRARHHGFQGKMCIHPRQLATVRTAYAPTPEEVVRARRIVEGFERDGGGSGSAVKIDGMMVDYPIFAAARRTLADAAAQQGDGQESMTT